MIVGTGFENIANEPTCFPRGMQRSEDETNRYVYRYIGHESSLVVCFSNIPAYFSFSSGVCRYM